MEQSIACRVPARVTAVMDALERAGHRGYLVGGSLRDLLLGTVPHDFDLTTNATPEEMLERARDCYAHMAKAIEADAIIPCGEAMLLASRSGMERVHRDTYHASKGAGRYLLALCWYKLLTEKDITNNDFNEFDEPVSEEERQIVINAVNAVSK